MKAPTLDKIMIDDLGRTLELTDEGLTETLVKGETAVRQWFQIMLGQRPGLTQVYDFDDKAVGVDPMPLYDLPRAVAYAEIERNIKETAALNPVIVAVSGFDFERGKKTLTVSFTATLYSGEEVTVAYDI